MSTNNRVGRNPFDKKPKASIQATQAAPNQESMQPQKTSQATKTAKNKKSSKDLKTSQAELDLQVSQTAPLEPILKVSERKTEELNQAEVEQSTNTPTQVDTQRAAHEEQIIGELIDLPDENWQPLSMVPAQFIKQLFSRWL